jgi:hypothetical protein
MMNNSETRYWMQTETGIQGPLSLEEFQEARIIEHRIKSQKRREREKIMMIIINRMEDKK